MGSANPVLLFLVTLEEKKVYFVCLNDYIDKVILLETPYFHNIKTGEDKLPKSKVIYIPLENELTADPESLIPIKFYAKRSKYYNAFLKMQNQYSYLSRDSFWDYPKIDTLGKQEEFIDRIKHFINIVGYRDVWGDNVLPSDLFKEIQDNIQNAKRILSQPKINFDDCWSAANDTWKRMRNLVTDYEKVCREYYLPLHRNY